MRARTQDHSPNFTDIPIRRRVRRAGRVGAVAAAGVAVLLSALSAAQATTGSAAPTPAPPAADDITSYCADPTEFPGGINGVPGFVAERTCGYVDYGIDPDALLATFRTVPAGATPGSPPWVDTFVAAGDAAAARAADLQDRRNHRAHGLADRRRSRAISAWQEAAFWYFVARFPYPFSLPPVRAYDAHVAAVEAGGRLERGRGQLRVERIPTPAGELTGHLRLPDDRARGGVPLVVVLGGLDEWKADPAIVLKERVLREAGYATLSLDIPGTGQNPARSAAPGDAAVLAAAVQHAAAGDLRGVDPDRIGVYGISFGGHYAAALALTEPLVDAIVNLSGPLEETFDSEWCAQLPVPTLLAAAASLGQAFQELGVEGTCAALAPLRFSEQGLIPVTDDPTPILTISGTADPLIADGDFGVLGRSGAVEDTAIFAGDGHLAGANAPSHEALAVAWLAPRLN